MPNQVPIFLVPADEDGVCRALADAHRRDTGYVHARRRVTGHLRQGRYGDVAAVLGADASAAEAAEFRKLRRSETTGRPIGGNTWLEALEAATGRPLNPQKRGPKTKPVDRHYVDLGNCPRNPDQKPGAIHSKRSIVFYLQSSTSGRRVEEVQDVSRRSW